MKKLLVVLLTLALCVTTLASCDFLSNLFGEKEPEVVYDVDAAANYVYNLYKDKNVTAADFEVTAVAAIAGVKHTVEWSVNTDKVKIEKKNDTTYIVNVDEKSTEEVKYVLTATIKGGDKTATKSFNLTVPVYVLMTWDEYIAAEKGATITAVEGVVTGIVSKAAGATYNCVFLQDATGGAYYVYGMANDPADLGIEIGMTVSATGTKDIYSGTHEIKDATVSILSKEKTPVTPADYTEAFKNAATLKDEALVKMQSSLVTIKGVEIGGQALDNGYLYFKLAGKEAYLRISGSTLAFATADKDAFIATHAEKRGWKADVTGIISLYDGNFYLVPVSTSAFNYIELIVKTDEEKAQEALDELNIPESINKTTELVLPTTSTLHNDVSIAWVSSDTTNFAIVDNKINVVPGAATVTFKLTATATINGKTATKEFTVEVAPSVVLSTTAPYIPSLFQAKLDGGKTLYLDGGVSTRYLTTTDDVTKAVAVYAEAAEGGYKFYILKDGVKNYIYLYKNADSKDSVKYDPENANVFSYNATLNAWATDFGGVDYYLGTYNTFNTVSASKLSYITAENTGVDQFPLEYSLVVENVALNASLFQAKLDGGKTLYLDGGVSTRYLTTTEDATKAVAIYAEKAEGGYKFYILKDGAKNYLYLYKNADSKDSVKYDPENANVFYYNVELNAWATDFGGVEYYLGTYNTFNTVSCSKLSYITAENTGVDQFPLNYAIAPAAPEQGGEEGGEEGGDNTDTPAPDAPAGSITASKTIAALITELGWTSSTTKQTFTLDDKVTVKIDGGNNTGKAYDGDHIRVYATDSPAGTITISVAEGYELVSVKISAVTGTYAFLYVGDATTDICNVSTAVSGSSVVLNSVKNGDNGKQVRVTAIEVVYKPVA